MQVPQGWKMREIKYCIVVIPSSLRQRVKTTFLSIHNEFIETGYYCGKRTGFSQEIISSLLV